jgi:copper chaperone
MCDSHHHRETATAAPGVGAGTTFHVSDMTCGHCAGVIRSALEESLPGAAIEIDIAKAQVTVSGDRAKAAEAIRTAGYTPELLAH